MKLSVWIKEQKELLDKFEERMSADFSYDPDDENECGNTWETIFHESK